MALDVDALVQPVSEAEPAGPDLSYDPDFRRISRELEEVAAKDKPGDDPTVGPALDTAIALLGRSRDFWVASHGACFALYAGDLATMAGMIRAMTVIAANFWESGYPALDEGSDPAGGRREAARQLTAFGLVIKHLERLPLSPLRSKGKLSFKDIAGAADERATGEQMLEQVAEAVRRAIDETPVEDWQALSAQFDDLTAACAALVAAFAEKVYSGQEPDLSPFTAMVARIKRLSDAVIARKIPVTEAEMGGEGAGEPGVQGVRGPISGRAQAIQQLETIKLYFQQSEPSSPLPLLIDRVIRLANMSFMEIMQSIAPNGYDDANRFLEPPPADGG
ncbi:MAG: type VI secretion system ImpA family N-terminal domain-containing protein [Micropepsaceae bacterium]